MATEFPEMGGGQWELGELKCLWRLGMFLVDVGCPTFQIPFSLDISKVL